ncbi:MAG: DUF1579 domain-containing protein [Ignavibacteriae bacterium]|nr:DUF1579 domain-containing protein [Ignavibacteriota bacterium]NOH00252.1 DUF1579 domain-containing protein [Ignavibacteriota bacterium]
MKNITNIFMILFLLIFTINISAQEEGEEMSAEMKAWMEYMTPGWAHEMMAKSAGEWTAENTMWEYPGAEPMKSGGKVKNEMILGGRYLQATHSGTVMGMPFEGLNLSGYDNHTKKFISIWIDNMGTGISKSEGTYDKKTNSINFTGNMIDPVTGKNMTYRSVAKMIDDDHQEFVMYMKDKDGKEFKSFIMKYTRK